LKVGCNIFSNFEENGDHIDQVWCLKSAPVDNDEETESLNFYFNKNHKTGAYSLYILYQGDTGALSQYADAISPALKGGGETTLPLTLASSGGGDSNPFAAASALSDALEPIIGLSHHEKPLRGRLMQIKGFQGMIWTDMTARLTLYLSNGQYNNAQEIDPFSM